MIIKTNSELQNIIADRIKREPVNMVAADLCIAEIYLSQIISGQRDVSKKVAEKMGYRLYQQPKPEKLFVPIDLEKQEFA